MLLGCGCGGWLEQVTAFFAVVDVSALTAWAHGWLEALFRGGGE